MYRKILYLILLFLGLTFKGYTQDSLSVSLLVTDFDTKAPLPYAHVLLTDSTGVTTDLEGRAFFSFVPGDSLTVKYQGYRPITIEIPETQEVIYFVHIPLSPDKVYLSEVIVRPFPATKEAFKEAFIAYGNVENAEKAKLENMQKNMQDLKKLLLENLHNYDKTAMDQTEMFRQFNQQLIDSRSNVVPTFGPSYSGSGGFYRTSREKQLEKLKKIKEQEKQALLQSLQKPDSLLFSPLDSAAVTE
ncbi:hypothetical protein [Algivirga pacifica]|uniref:CarboxypepD_reg-like domain-containing protein n=1 Tax=Algivirga pacifica TaxID=1162670 RepID=A0ABP9DIV6_9BACT